MKTLLRQSAGYLTLAAFFCAMGMSFLAAVIGKIILIVYMLRVEWPQLKQSIRSTMINLVLPLVGLISIVPIGEQPFFKGIFPVFSWPLPKGTFSGFMSPFVLITIVDMGRSVCLVYAVLILATQSVIALMQSFCPLARYESFSLGARAVVLILFNVWYYYFFLINFEESLFKKSIVLVCITLIFIYLSRSGEKYFASLNRQHGIERTGHMLYGYGMLDVLAPVVRIGYIGALFVGIAAIVLLAFILGIVLGIIPSGGKMIGV